MNTVIGIRAGTETPSRHRWHRKCLALVVLVASSSAQAGQPGLSEGRSLIPIHGAVNALSEQCAVYPNGGVVNFEFLSKWSLDFNVHHHTDKTTEYPVKLSSVSNYQGSFVAEPEAEYCYMWLNKSERRDQWKITLDHQAQPLTAAIR